MSSLGERRARVLGGGWGEHEGALELKEESQRAVIVECDDFVLYKGGGVMTLNSRTHSSG
jgi:hypothetical protein